METIGKSDDINIVLECKTKKIYKKKHFFIIKNIFALNFYAIYSLNIQLTYIFAG